MHPDFVSYGISGIDSSKLLHGRPYGGCGFLIRKSILPRISPVQHDSTRFCAIEFSGDSFTTLIVCAYMPTNYGTQESLDLYRETLGELSGFLDSHVFDNVIIAGDLNVDFSRQSTTFALMQEFMSELQLVAVDLDFGNIISHTYERDDGMVRSWPDHILTKCYHSRLITDIHCIHSVANFSDHLPLCFKLLAPNVHVSTYAPFTRAADLSATGLSIQWQRVTDTDVSNYRQHLLCTLPVIPPELLSCCDPMCSTHSEFIDRLCNDFLTCLHQSGLLCLPTSKHGKGCKVVPGWNHLASPYRKSAQFWNKIWVEAGCPRNGILSDLRKSTKASYKYSVRRAKRRRLHLTRRMFAHSLQLKDKRVFWSEVRRAKIGYSHRKQATVIDGLSSDCDISNVFNSKLAAILNVNDISERQKLIEELNSKVATNDVEEICLSCEAISESLSSLGRDKCDGTDLSSNHLILASPVIVSFLTEFFSVILRHGYMPEALRNCTIKPIPKPHRDNTNSDNYRPIALAPNLSKVLERTIFLSYQKFFSSSDLQFGFKAGYSTDLCTGTLKCVVSRYINKGSSVFGCLLDASKAFDRVDHAILFRKLLARKLPRPIVRFLLHWYASQKAFVSWNSVNSIGFSVSNGVRQGGVLSPILFAVYMDELLIRLSNAGVGCYINHFFTGSLCYADDLVLLAPSPSALRSLLQLCEVFAAEHGIFFNAAKTQLICFRTTKQLSLVPKISFCGQDLKFTDHVIHLGHHLQYNLDDSEDIESSISDLCRKANYLLTTFSSCDPIVKTYLLNVHCFNVYGSSLWRLDCKRLKALEVAYNNILRKIWKLPRLCHVGILHCVAGLQGMCNRVFRLSQNFIRKALSHSSILIRHCFLQASSLSYTFVGYNSRFGASTLKTYSSYDHVCADYVKDIRMRMFIFESVDIREFVLNSICTD